MLTQEMILSIQSLLPALDDRSYALRQLVRTLSCNGGEMSLAEACAVMGANSPPLLEGSSWDGVRLTGCGAGATIALAPYVRKAIGLPVAAAELLADLGHDPACPQRAFARRIPPGVTTSATMDFVRLDANDWKHATPEELAQSTELRRARLEQAARQAGYDGNPCPSCHERRTVSSRVAHACEACGYHWVAVPAPPDPLLDVRRAVACATNVEYALVGEHIVAPTVLPRDCAGTEIC